MDFKKVKTDTTAVTRNVTEFMDPTGNMYETLVVLSKRANQISAELKEELIQKIQEFSSVSDNLDEVFENREQIELSKYYENLPKATLMSIHEFLQDKLYYRKPEQEENN